ncbi:MULTISPECIES: YhdB family protein [unclassified Bacillus (in: firmicutes)]|uniref:YhdB family protein n=1 Tax=Bacillus TaxID=1386 RepID=UPI00338F5DAE
MNVADYDKALYYTHRSQWDNLLILMVRTQDDLLSKRIEHFLHAYQFNRNDADVEKCLNGLLQYIDHASEVAASDLYSEPIYT